nr:hypothetical protein [Bradyrhizobium altum]
MIMVVMIVIIVAMIVVTMVMVMFMIVVMLVVVVMRMIMRLMLVPLIGGHAVLVMPGIVFMMPDIGGVFVSLGCRQRLCVACTLDHLALDTVAMTAAAGIAMARPAAMAAVLVLFLGLAMGALVGFDQRLTVGDRDLVIVGMDFAEGEEAVPVAAILDEGSLQ